MRRRCLVEGFSAASKGPSSLGCVDRRACRASSAPGRARLCGEWAARQGRADSGFGRLRGLRRPRRRGPRSRRGAADHARAPTSDRASPGPRACSPARPPRSPRKPSSARGRKWGGPAAGAGRPGRPRRLVLASPGKLRLGGEGRAQGHSEGRAGRGARACAGVREHRATVWSPPRPPPLCARAAAPPSRACESPRAAGRSLLRARTGLGHPPGADLSRSSASGRWPGAWPPRPAAETPAGAWRQVPEAQNSVDAT